MTQSVTLTQVALMSWADVWWQNVTALMVHLEASIQTSVNG